VALTSQPEGELSRGELRTEGKRKKTERGESKKWVAKNPSTQTMSDWFRGGKGQLEDSFRGKTPPAGQETSK